MHEACCEKKADQLGSRRTGADDAAAEEDPPPVPVVWSVYSGSREHKARF